MNCKLAKGNSLARMRVYESELKRFRDGIRILRKLRLFKIETMLTGHKRNG